MSRMPIQTSIVAPYLQWDTSFQFWSTNPTSRQSTIAILQQETEGSEKWETPKLPNRVGTLGPLNLGTRPRISPFIKFLVSESHASTHSLKFPKPSLCQSPGWPSFHRTIPGRHRPPRSIIGCDASVQEMPCSCLVMQDVCIQNGIQMPLLHRCSTKQCCFGNSLRASSSSSAACSYPTKAMEQHSNSQGKYLGLVLANNLVRLRVTSSIARQNLCYTFCYSFQFQCHHFAHYMSYPPFFSQTSITPEVSKVPHIRLLPGSCLWYFRSCLLSRQFAVRWTSPSVCQKNLNHAFIDKFCKWASSLHVYHCRSPWPEKSRICLHRNKAKEQR